MKRKLIVVVFGIAQALPVSGQTANTSSTTNGQASLQAESPMAQASAASNTSSTTSANRTGVNGGVNSGTTFNAVLSKSIDAKKAKEGDAVEARTTEAVKSGKYTVLPKGTKLVGHVTKASARAKGESQSVLGITLDRAVLKDGTEVPLNLGLQALSAPTMIASAPIPEMESIGASNVGLTGSGATRISTQSGTSALGRASRTAGTDTGEVVNAAGRSVSGTANAGTSLAGDARGAGTRLDAAGQLTSRSRGVFGLSGLSLASGTTNHAAGGGTITSPNKNIHLDGGTRMLLVAQGQSSSLAQ